MKFFLKKELICEITADFVKDTVSFVNYTDKWPLLPFGKIKHATINDFYNFAEDRVMPASRFDCKDVLKKIGLSTYDSIEILKFDICCTLSDAVININYHKVEDIYE